MIFLQTLAANAEPESTTKMQHFHNIKKITAFSSRGDVCDYGKQPKLHKEAFSSQQNTFKQLLCLLMSCMLCIRGERLSMYKHSKAGGLLVPESIHNRRTLLLEGQAIESESHNKSRALNERTIGKNEGMNNTVKKSTKVDRATSNSKK